VGDGKLKKNKLEEIQLFPLVALEIGLFDWLIWGPQKIKKTKTKTKKKLNRTPKFPLSEGTRELH
jgi:hypothetical protein